MKIIIPMAGYGQRFKNCGYQLPKPLIKVNNKMVIEYIVDMFDNKDEIIFICNQKHIDDDNIKDVLLSHWPDAQILAIPIHNFGPVFTVQAAYDYIDDNEEVMICYCDNSFIWNYEDFKKKARNYDGCILTHTGLHPHTLNSTKMAFLKVDGKGLLEEIKEKECYTEDPKSEHASTGAYYFKSGALLKKYCDLSMEKDLNYNGEYYVTLVYNLLVSDGLKVGYYDTPFVTVFGTPEEVESFEAWHTILNSGQVKSQKDLLDCYKYWKGYHENNIC